MRSFHLSKHYSPFKCTCKHALQDLQNVIVNRIHKFGAKDKVENKIDINYRCDKEVFSVVG